MPIAWIFFSYCAVVLVLLPIVIGIVSRTSLRAILFSAVCAATGPTLYLGASLYRFSTQGLPDAGPVLLVGSATLAAIVGWLVHRISRFVRLQPPPEATWSALRFLSLTAIKLVLLYVLVDGFWILVAVAFADEVPWLMYLRVHWWHYASVGAAVVLVLAWSFIAAHRGKMSNPMARASLGVLPAATIALLFVPMGMAYPQLMDWTPLLDCSPRAIAGYVPHMMDYGWFVLRSLGTGAVLGLNSALGWQSAGCRPESTSSLATALGFGLHLVPASLLVLVAFRYKRLRGGPGAT